MPSCIKLCTARHTSHKAHCLTQLGATISRPILRGLTKHCLQSLAIKVTQLLQALPSMQVILLLCAPSQQLRAANASRCSSSPAFAAVAASCGEPQAPSLQLHLGTALCLQLGLKGRLRIALQPPQPLQHAAAATAATAAAPVSTAAQ